MIIKIWLREQKLIHISYEQNMEMNSDPMVQKYDHYLSTLEITFDDYMPNLLPMH